MVCRLKRDLTGGTFRMDDKGKESEERSKLRYVIKTSSELFALYL